MLKKLFRKSRKAMVFIDYEYCFYSYQNLFDMRPEPKNLIDTISKEFNIKDIMIFGDFAPYAINSELRKLRNITNTIIETGNTVRHHKKDMTDFVMLDYIYRCDDDHKDVDTYIIFTGDGHFHSVIKHLVKQKKKRVIVFGVRESINRQLFEVASEVRYIPAEEELAAHLYKLIAANFDFIKNKPHIYPSFNATVDIVSKRHHIDSGRIRTALGEMIDCGYLTRRERTSGTDRSRTVTVLDANWDKLIEDGIWLD